MTFFLKGLKSFIFERSLNYELICLSDNQELKKHKDISRMFLKLHKTYYGFTWFIKSITNFKFLTLCSFLLSMMGYVSASTQPVTFGKKFIIASNSVYPDRLSTNDCDVLIEFKFSLNAGQILDGGIIDTHTFEITNMQGSGIGKIIKNDLYDITENKDGILLQQKKVKKNRTTETHTNNIVNVKIGESEVPPSELNGKGDKHLKEEGVSKHDSIQEKNKDTPEQPPADVIDIFNTGTESKSKNSIEIENSKPHRHRRVHSASSQDTETSTSSDTFNHTKNNQKHLNTTKVAVGSGITLVFIGVVVYVTYT